MPNPFGYGDQVVGVDNAGNARVTPPSEPVPSPPSEGSAPGTATTPPPAAKRGISLPRPSKKAAILGLGAAALGAKAIDSTVPGGLGITPPPATPGGPPATPAAAASPLPGDYRPSTLPQTPADWQAADTRSLQLMQEYSRDAWTASTKRTAVPVNGVPQKVIESTTVPGLYVGYVNTDGVVVPVGNEVSPADFATMLVANAAEAPAGWGDPTTTSNPTTDAASKTSGDATTKGAAASGGGSGGTSGGSGTRPSGGGSAGGGGGGGSSSSGSRSSGGYSSGGYSSGGYSSGGYSSGGYSSGGATNYGGSRGSSGGGYDYPSSGRSGSGAVSAPALVGKTAGGNFDDFAAEMSAAFGTQAGEVASQDLGRDFLPTDFMQAAGGSKSRAKMMADTANRKRRLGRGQRGATTIPSNAGLRSSVLTALKDVRRPTPGGVKHR